jgi:hypothetical protein
MKAKVTSNKVQGEGDYKAAKQYGDSVKAFVDSGKVDQAVKKAKPTSPADQAEMTQAEQVGLSKSKGGESVATLSVKKKKST